MTNNNRIKTITGFAGWVAMSNMALAAEAVPDKQPEYQVYKASTPIVIDGQFDDQAWQDAEPSPVFADITDGSPARYPVQARMMWDDKYLYFALSAGDPDVWAAKIVRDDPMGLKIEGWQTPGKRKQAYTESFFKIYLAPDGIGRRYTETHINPLGKICDKWHKSPWRKEVSDRIGAKHFEKPDVPEWNCDGMRQAVAVRGTLNDQYDIDDGWQAEIAIPFTELAHLTEGRNYPPRPGDRWLAHLGRRYAARGGEASYWTWPVIGVRDCHNPDRWGGLIFRAERTFAQTAKTAHLPKPQFAWRAMWARHKDMLTLESISNLVNTLEKMHINAVIASASAWSGTVCYDSEFYPKPKGVTIDPLGELIRAARSKNIQVYAWTINLRAMDKQYIRQHPELAQQIQPWEEQSIKMPRATPDRVNAHPGDWLCPDRGLDPEEARFLTELASRYDLDGIGLDYLGYRNYYACFCDYSRAQRLQFAEAHPEMDAKEVLAKYSEERLVEWTRQTRELLLKIKPDLKLAIHIYPDFDLNPLYPSKLHVDYCGQTVAWFYKPFWSYGKILDLCEAYQAESGKHHAFNRFVPFVGVYGGDKLKTPERLRREIRIAGSVGAQGIMLAFFETFREHPELIEVVKEEFAPCNE